MARDFVGKDRALDIVRSITGYNGKAIEDLEPASIEVRDAVYNAFLDKLVLSPRHRDALNARGLKNDLIDRNNYKTTPMWDSAEGICSLLIKDGYSLERIPGFYKNREGKWTFMTLPGFLIPVRDQKQRIQGFQIRVDDKYLELKEDIKKYIWFSSVSKNGGCSSGAPVHAALPLNREIKPETKLWITEGPLKADIASAYMGLPFLGVAGVSLYRQAAQEAKKMQVNKAVIAYDADLQKNPHVKDAEKELVKELMARGIKATPVTWAEVLGKGIDDLVTGIISEEFPLPKTTLERLITVNAGLQKEIQIDISIKVKRAEN